MACRERACGSSIAFDDVLPFWAVFEVAICRCSILSKTRYLRGLDGVRSVTVLCAQTRALSSFLALSPACCVLLAVALRLTRLVELRVLVELARVAHARS